MNNNEKAVKPKIHEKLTKNALELKKQMAAQMLTLSTSAFGLVAALAWNEFIQTAVKEYIKPLIGGSSAIISQLIYAVLITLLAVLVTYQLSKFAEKKEG